MAEPIPLTLRHNSSDIGDLRRATLSRSQTRHVLFALVTLTILPRAFLAWRLEAVCNDAYYYQWVATMWEQGRTATALKYLNINVYPLILWGLKAAGLSWPLSGKLWGLLVSGLTVLPLFGLMRRLFDDRVAAVSVFLFAVHPGLIALSVEPIREPTFWFLFLLSAYWIYCSATAAGGWLRPCAAGIATALAVHTRTEGWALLVLLFAWPWTLVPPDVTRRRRLLRIAAALGMIPAFLLAANMSVLRDHDRWEWGRFAHLRSFVEWLPVDLAVGDLDPFQPRIAAAADRPQDRTGEHDPQRADVRPTRADEPTGKSMRAGKSPAYVFVNQFAEELGYVHLVFLLIGLLSCGRESLRGGRWPLAVIFGGILLAVWVRLTQYGNMNGRYFLTAHFVALPTEAAGVLFAAARLRIGLERTPRYRGIPRAIPVALVMGLTSAFAIKALMRMHPGRERQAELGRRIRAELPPFRVVEVDRSAVRVGHFALGSLPNVNFDDEGDGPPPPKPDVIIAAEPVPPPVRERAAGLGLVEFSPRDMQHAETGFRVFARPVSVRRTAIASRESGRERR